MSAQQSSDANIDHRAIVRALSDDQRRYLREKSDWAGLTHLAGHLGLIILGGTYIALALPLWPLALLPLGIVLIFLFTLLHECMHDTPFNSPWLNRAAAIACGFIILIPPNWFRYFHMAHHRHTHDPENDPELATPKPETWLQYGIYLSGIPTWVSAIKNALALAFGNRKDVFVTERAMAGIRLEARVFVAAYTVLIIASVVSANTMLLWLWVVPVLLGNHFCGFIFWPSMGSARMWPICWITPAPPIPPGSCGLLRGTCLTTPSITPIRLYRFTICPNFTQSCANTCAKRKMAIRRFTRSMSGGFKALSKQAKILPLFPF